MVLTFDNVFFGGQAITDFGAVNVLTGKPELGPRVPPVLRNRWRPKNKPPCRMLHEGSGGIEEFCLEDFRREPSVVLSGQRQGVPLP